MSSPPVDPVRTDARLQALLDQFADAEPADRPAVEAEIRSTFEEELAVLVLDMAGSSSSVIRDGILHFLARVSQMRAVAVPAVQRHGGALVKFIADDILAAFPTADAALGAALEIREATSVALGVPQSDMQFDVCVGIGWGPTLHVPGADLWGDQVNQAFKLGEDTAGPGEILLTDAAYRALTNKPARAKQVEISVSGLTLDAWSV